MKILKIHLIEAESRCFQKRKKTKEKIIENKNQRDKLTNQQFPAYSEKNDKKKVFENFSFFETTFDRHLDKRFLKICYIMAATHTQKHSKPVYQSLST